MKIKRIQTILKTIAAEYYITVSELKGKSRKYPRPEARKMFCLFATREGFPRYVIYEELSMHHSVFSHNMDKIKHDIESYPDTKKHFENIAKKLNASKTDKTEA